MESDPAESYLGKLDGLAYKPEKFVATQLETKLDLKNLVETN
jgi:hypothetical protein